VPADSALVARKEAKRDKKRHRDKEATCASFTDVTKRALDVKESIARAKATEAEAMLLHEENRIMLADLNIMAPVTKGFL
jgi:hypothetical protein